MDARILAFATLLLTTLLSACSDTGPEPATSTGAGGEAPTLAPLAAAERLRQQAHAANVTIIRDDFGIPHIYGKTDADAVFGLLYAQSEDDFPRVERNYIWALGRLAEVDGESALYSDLRARLYMTEIEAREAYTSAPDWLKQLCIAFADGINYYLYKNPQVKPALITHFEPWMPMYFFEGSIGGDIEQIPLQGIDAFYSRSRDELLAGSPRAEQVAAGSRTTHEEPSGSNGIAISSKLSASGHPLLLINPHTSFYFRGEVHMVSDEGLNAYGAVTWGQFFIYQGFNERTGWMHTSTYADFMDSYLEDVFEQEGRLLYRHGSALRYVEVDKITLQYRDGDALRSRTFPTYHTHHGPIVGISDGRWMATRINWDPVTALSQSWLRTRQTDLASFRQVMESRSNSSNNTVYADASGNIAYFHGNFMPKRNPGFDYSQPVDGSNPLTDWQGLHTLDEMIIIENPDSGWIQNANSTPFTAAGASSPDPADYPPYMAPDAETFRGMHAARLLNDIAGDGKETLSMDELIALSYHPALPAFEVLIPPLVQHYLAEGGAYPDLGPVVTALDAWDTTVSVDSRTMAVAHFYALAVQDAQPEDSPLQRMEWFTRFADSAPASQQLALLQSAVDHLEEDFGRWDVAWGEVNRFQRLDGAIVQRFDDDQPSLPVGLASGRWGALAAYGARPGENTRRIYGYRGNSFVAVVEFGPLLRAKSLLAGGQSGNPESPHFFDQAGRYINRQFKDVAFYRDDVEARATRRYHPGE